MYLKGVHKSAYNTIQIAQLVFTIIYIMLIKCNAYAKVYEIKKKRKIGQIAIVATSQSWDFYIINKPYEYFYQSALQ
jgi:hypothetical protein